MTDPALTARFHPLVARWFERKLGRPTRPQEEGWRHIENGENTLIAAPTGSGKTLAAFLWAIDRLVREATAGEIPDRIHAVYVSPLKALGNDIQRNLEEPLAEIRALAAEDGIELGEIRVMVRSGDTPASERRKMARRPPHILITTPESLYILLTAEGSRRHLRTAGTVIVDEIHAIAADKRGAHLALSLERLDLLAGRRLQRIGLSATQRPIAEVAGLLVGVGRAGGDPPRCAIVDMGHRRDMRLSVEVPDRPLGGTATHEQWAEVYDRIAALTAAHRTTIVFVNTRRLVERVAHHLTERLGEGRVAAHHGSLSRATRLQAESRLKSGEVPVVVATASLELGIDVGTVDLVCHIGSPRSISTLLQRVGRSRHRPGAAPGDGPEPVPKGIVFPLTRDQLLECAAAIRAIGKGQLDLLSIPEAPLDVLAQQAVAIAACEEIGEEELWDLVRRAWPYRSLERRDFEAVLEVLSEGLSTRTGRRSAHIHRDRVNGVLRGRRGARLTAITCGGAIPDNADYDVIEEPAGILVGKVNEDFAVESLAGDIFLLGNHSWKIRRVESGRIRVEDARGAPPSIPFWLGEAPGRSAELSGAVSDLRRDLEACLPDTARAEALLQEEAGLGPPAARELVEYLAACRTALGVLPRREVLVAERFFDESGGMQVVVHAPFGGRVNRAFGLALRKRFCRTFDFELQAAATDDGVLLSLGEGHSFPLETIFQLVRSRTLEEDLVQAILQAPMFGNRWRWNATRALALPRFQGGRRVPMPIQRMRAEDLLLAVFPAQVACQDNHAGGPIEPPDHPLVNETLDNCLREAMDIDGLRLVIEGIESGAIRTVAVDTPAPSPLCHEILRSNPYTFLDDAPLEERRARAVALRRTDPDLAGGIGALDPQAIEEVAAQSWPDVRSADELHDALLGLVLLPAADAARWDDLAGELIRGRRAARVRWTAGEPEEPPRDMEGLVAAERIDQLRAVLPDAELDPELQPIRPSQAGGEPANPPAISEEAAMAALVQGWMAHLGPITAPALARRLGLRGSAVDRALLDVESQGLVLRGTFTPGAPGEVVEWCDRRALARIHRLTIGRLRREIEPVSAADFMRFLFLWHHLEPGARLHAKQGLREVIGQLEGLEISAPAWERDVLPARIEGYDPDHLEALCLSGEVAWGRLTVSASLLPGDGQAPTPPRGRRGRRPAPSRSAPLAFVLREHLGLLLGPAPELDAVEGLSPAAREVMGHLARHGASFLADIARALGRMAVQVEWALWELVSRGLATGDGIAGLRALLSPEKERRPPRRAHPGPGRRTLPGSLIAFGRWSLLRPPGAVGPAAPPAAEREEWWAWALLRRHGVVFRDLLARESGAPPWRALLAIYRRLEDRGEIRGGRFVAGFVGEEFALPEAVEALRAVRRRKEREAGRLVVISAADPLNLVGIITPGARVSPSSGQFIAWRDGVPVEVGYLGEIRSRLGLPGKAESAGSPA
jgi:ATP-dependent helicase Lhr and Lhr-like helicase